MNPINLLREEDPVKRRQGLTLMADRPATEQLAARPLLQQCLLDADDAVRWGAAMLLYRLLEKQYAVRVSQRQIEHLKDGTLEQRTAVLERIEAKGQREPFDEIDEVDLSATLPLLCAALSDPAKDVQSAALNALNTASYWSELTADAAPSLIAFLKGADDQQSGPILDILLRSQGVDWQQVYTVVEAFEDDIMLEYLLKITQKLKDTDRLEALLRRASDAAFPALFAVLKELMFFGLTPSILQLLFARSRQTPTTTRLDILSFLLGSVVGQERHPYLAMLVEHLHPDQPLEIRIQTASRIQNHVHAVDTYGKTTAEKKHTLMLFQIAVDPLTQCLDTHSERLVQIATGTLSTLLNHLDPSRLAAIIDTANDQTWSALRPQFKPPEVLPLDLRAAITRRRLPEVTAQLLDLKQSAQTIWFRSGRSKPDNTYLFVVPAVIGQLKQLREIVLEKQCLLALPPEIGLLENLESLTITDNPLCELPDTLCQLQKLHTFHSRNNNLQRLPDDFGRLKALKSIQIHSAAMTHLPASFVELSALTHLDLWGGFEHLPEDFSALSSLQHLTVKAKLTALPPGLQKLPLKGLTLRHLPQFPEEILELRALEYLDLSDCQFSEIPAAVAELPRLQALFLDRTPIPSLPQAILDRKAQGLSVFFG